MKKLNDRWYDKNNNSWNADVETKESALTKSKTLSYCTDCTDCTDCINCRGCTDCTNCTDCTDCINCRGCSYCTVCTYFIYCRFCSYCTDCTDCRGCSKIKENPQRYITPKIGSRKSRTSIYWTNKDDVQIICGCWRGNIKEFEKRVKEVHADTEHLKPYLNQIRIFKYLVKQLIK